ncbi:MAG: hypothetical protein QGF71_05810 [Rhodospirillales bacterium]|jgi:hypothetical protein|nr:hypothetical protein [Rhodospirillales bacterium]
MDGSSPLKLVVSHPETVDGPAYDGAGKKLATKLRWVSQSLVQQGEEMRVFEGNLTRLDAEIAQLGKNCQRYLNNLGEIDAKPLQLKSAQLARIAGRWAASG